MVAGVSPAFTDLLKGVPHTRDTSVMDLGTSRGGLTVACRTVLSVP